MNNVFKTIPTPRGVTISDVIYVSRGVVHPTDHYKKEREKRSATGTYHHFTSLPSSDPHISRKHEQPDREEQDSRGFRDRGARGWSIEFRIDCHVAPSRMVSPVVDARVDSCLVVRAPPVADCAHLIGLVIHEQPLVTIARVVVLAVCDDVVVLDRIARASLLQVESCVRVVLHPVARYVVVARRI